MEIELRQMRYFVAAAEELHFTRAAARLHISQQPLSAAIARLEAQLGVKLFDRTTRRVELTEAGVAYLESARAAIEAADAATESVLARARGEIGDVSIGVALAAWYGLGELFSTLSERYPDLRLHVRQQSSRPLMQAVLAGELDLAIGLCVRPAAGVDLSRLKNEPVVLVLASTHPLASESTAELGAVSGETFVLDEPDQGPGYNEAVLDLCRRAGFTPATRIVPTHHDAWERAIAAGEAVGLTTERSLHAAHPGVRALPLSEPATFPLDLVTREGSTLTPTAQTVVSVALETSERLGWLSPQKPDPLR